MGLIYRKYAIYRSCPDCNVKYVDELKIGEGFILFKPIWVISEKKKAKKLLVSKANSLGRCKICNHDLHPLPESHIYYILRGTNHKIPHNSIIAFLFVKIPTILFGFLGITTFIIFILKGISYSYEGFRLAFLEVYELLVTEIFATRSYFSPIFVLLSIYFVSRVAILIYRFIKNPEE